MEKQDKFED